MKIPGFFCFLMNSWPPTICRPSFSVDRFSVTTKSLRSCVCLLGDALENMTTEKERKRRRKRERERER
jgi:hypothetical protein